MSEAVTLGQVAEVSATPAGVVVRKALLPDVVPLVGLISGYASQGIMLPRTEFEMAENIRDFTVVVHDGVVAGCGALHFYGLRTGEIRSLAVLGDSQKLGLGSRLVEALEAEALAHGLQSVFAFTYIPDFFARHGYLEVDRQLLPAKVWRDCLRCPKLQCCDEIAVRKLFVPEAGTTSPWGDYSGGESTSNGALIRPVVGQVKSAK